VAYVLGHENENVTQFKSPKENLYRTGFILHSERYTRCKSCAILIEGVACYEPSLRRDCTSEWNFCERIETRSIKETVDSTFRLEAKKIFNYE